jgi:hypothetical protein
LPSGPHDLVHLIADDPNNIDSIYKIDVGGTLRGSSITEDTGNQRHSDQFPALV